MTREGNSGITEDGACMRAACSYVLAQNMYHRLLLSNVLSSTFTPQGKTKSFTIYMLRTTFTDSPFPIVFYV